MIKTKKFDRAAKSRSGFDLTSDKGPDRKWRMLAGILLCLSGLGAPSLSVHADTLTATNNTPITTPDSGIASTYPSTIGFGGFGGKITAVHVILNNITHTFPGDYDILLVGPGGQKTLLMSDCGGSGALNNVSIAFSETGPPLPNNTQISTGTYRPTNFGAITDAFPPDGPTAYFSSLAVFNNTSPNGTWSLYVVDDAGGDVGSIAGGWTINIETTAFQNNGVISIPDSGAANPYPSNISVTGLPATVSKMRVRLSNISHSFPDDIDVLLVGPGGQNAIIMSDVGGSLDASFVSLTLDDDAANPLPDAGQLVDGTFQPTNIGTGDGFPAPAPIPSGGSALSVFDGLNPNGNWSLFVVDDAAGDTGTITRWNLEFDPEPTVLANISTRLRVETGDNALIGGFIVTGTQPKRVIVRAIGPSLPLPGVISDPTLELRDGNGGLIIANDDWRFGGQEAEIIATGIPPTNDLESAVVATLPANSSNYTAIVRGFNNATGIALVEAYDLDRTVDSKLANISTRGLVQTDDNVLIAGTIVLGYTSQRVIVRAIGPSLTVPGKLEDPTLELRDSNGVLIAENDDWQSDQASDIVASTIPPSNSLESAIVATLPSQGAFYTAIVRGFNGLTGVAVVEIYALN